MLLCRTIERFPAVTANGATWWLRRVQAFDDPESPTDPYVLPTLGEVTTVTDGGLRCRSLTQSRWRIEPFGYVVDRVDD